MGCRSDSRATSTPLTASIGWGSPAPPATQAKSTSTKPACSFTALPLLPISPPSSTNWSPPWPPRSTRREIRPVRQECSRSRAFVRHRRDPAGSAAHSHQISAVPHQYQQSALPLWTRAPGRLRPNLERGAGDRAERTGQRRASERAGFLPIPVGHAPVQRRAVERLGAEH